MYELYQMRMNKPEDRIEPYTTKDIDIQYGFVAEETDDVFTTPEKMVLNYIPRSLFLQHQYKNLSRNTMMKYKN